MPSGLCSWLPFAFFVEMARQPAALLLAPISASGLALSREDLISGTAAAPTMIRPHHHAHNQHQQRATTLSLLLAAQLLHDSTTVPILAALGHDG